MNKFYIRTKEIDMCWNCPNSREQSGYVRVNTRTKQRPILFCNVKEITQAEHENDYYAGKPIYFSIPIPDWCPLEDYINQDKDIPIIDESI